MKKLKTIERWFLTVVATMVLLGCATQFQFLNNRKEMALQTVMNRAKFDMGCPKVTAAVLSKEFEETDVIATVDMNIQRAKYTVSVVGCQKNINTL